ncbi:ras and Rab interactor 3 isoform X2 [Erpetoichthys calabaricus]|nr:ras and Rab interactor 3 isoform X2 [Erpetoichthys calabaricus]
MVLSIRFPDQNGEPRIKDVLIKEEKSLLYLDGSVLVFDDIFKLVAFYCVSRDVLPFTLSLPQVITESTKYEDLDTISSLGSDFWGSSLNQRAEAFKKCGSRQAQHLSTDNSHCSCEIELSIGSDRLWYVNPIFIEEYCNSLHTAAPITRSQSLTTESVTQPRYKRPPPIPPRPRPEELFAGIRAVKQTGTAIPSTPNQEVKHGQNEGAGTSCQVAGSVQQTETRKPLRIPPIPPRKQLSGKHLGEAAREARKTPPSQKQQDKVPVATLVNIEGDDTEGAILGVGGKMSLGMNDLMPVPTEPSPLTMEKTKKDPPVPPPRKKRQSYLTSVSRPQGTSAHVKELPSSLVTSSISISSIKVVEPSSLKGSDTSLYSPEGNLATSNTEHDSYSTSSTEEDTEHASSPVSQMKRNPTIMLDKAKQRLSMANLSHVFTAFMCADRKLQKRITELAQDKESYFGNLVLDYKAYTLDTMKKQASSTEMLQEIRQMMTQLKSYLIQSTELQGLTDATVYTEEKLEVIIEAALCKCVLKPLRETIYSGLKEIHTEDLSLQRLLENQQVVVNTTTTDLGVTTCVPEVTVMEKIQHKFTAMHKAYSPEKKITVLLKTCKIIYESMSVGSQGKPHGADDFLPVLMYVLARSNLTALLLDVEYMMELMDPALQLGEGSYYLTTTYGALEHIKSYDKIAVTRQLSLEVQDSIHRWERRRTLNKARASRSSVQDFINISFNEACMNTKTLGARPDTTVQDLCRQCADKFEVDIAEQYGIFVLVDGAYQQLASDDLPLAIKAAFHHSEPKKEYFFVYKLITCDGGLAKMALSETENI